VTHSRLLLNLVKTVRGAEERGVLGVSRSGGLCLGVHARSVHPVLGIAIPLHTPRAPAPIFAFAHLPASISTSSQYCLPSQDKLKH
jgi:hypothetical protein